MNDKNTCRVCGKEIRILIRRGSGVCSNDCEKKLERELEIVQDE